MSETVQGFMFESVAGYPRNGHICKIIGRAEPSADGYEPRFVVEFADGVRDEADSSELHPWYPT